jgi:hypothetical protein
MKAIPLQTQKQSPQDRPRGGSGTIEVVLRLFDLLNTWQALVIVVTLFLIFDGFLFFLH